MLLGGQEGEKVTADSERGPNSIAFVLAGILAEGIGHVGLQLTTMVFNHAGFVANFVAVHHLIG